MLWNLLMTIKDKMIKLSKREKLLFVAFVCLILVGIMSKLLMPQMEAYKLLQKQVQMDEQKLVAINKQFTSVPRAKQAEEKAKQKLDAYNDYFSQEINDGTVLEAISAIMMNTDLQLLSFNPQETVDNHTYCEFPIDIVVLGELAQITAFVEKLEHQQYLSEIKKMNVIVPSSNNPKDKAKAQISLIIYLKGKQ